MIRNLLPTVRIKDTKARQKRRNIEVLKKLFTIIKYADSKK